MSREHDTVYRVRYTMVGLLAGYGAMMLVLLVSAFGRHARFAPWQAALGVLAVVLVTSPAFRGALASVRASRGGLVVVNPVRTHRVSWDEVDRIEIGSHGAFIFEFCLIYLKGGKVIPVVGLATVPGQPRRRASVEARQACDALNTLLTAAREEEAR